MRLYRGKIEPISEDVIRKLTGDGLIEIRLPEGRSTVELTYGPDAWDRVGTLGTILTLAALAGWGLRVRRASRLNRHRGASRA
jgi:hypothetical protein